MPDRVVVDRIDFREALVFPRVFASAVGALQPPRILLATFALLCLIVVGRAYDVVRGPSVQPAGLLATSRTSVDSAVASDVARRVAREALPMDRRPAGADGFGGRVNVEEVRSALLARRGEVSGTELEAVQRAIERLVMVARHLRDDEGLAVAAPVALRHRVNAPPDRPAAR